MQNKTISNMKLKFSGCTVTLITTLIKGRTIYQVLSNTYEPSQRDMWIDAVIQKVLEGKFK